MKGQKTIKSILLLQTIALFYGVVVWRSASAQDIYKLEKGTIRFFAGTPVEDIDGMASKAVSFINFATGEFAISIQNIDFKFKRKLMEEHFNENYMESHLYPKSEYKGKFENPITPDQLAALQELNTIGKLNIHGILADRRIPVFIQKTNEGIVVKGTFFVPLEAHKIERPKLLWEKLAEKVEVKLDLLYKPYIK